MSDRTRAAEASALGFGPWAQHLADGERRARWRSLAALAIVYAGGAHPLLRACVAAEDDPAAASTAWLALESLPALTKRRLLAAYASLDSLRQEQVRSASHAPGSAHFGAAEARALAGQCFTWNGGSHGPTD